jgi:hypothetical protein
VSWSRRFDDLIPLPRGRQLVTLKDAADYIMKLSKAEQSKPDIKHVEMKPDWKRHGPAAGPMRNQRMLDWGPDLVVAFAGGKGTADMVRRARAAGVDVIEP